MFDKIHTTKVVKAITAGMIVLPAKKKDETPSKAAPPKKEEIQSPTSGADDGSAFTANNPVISLAYDNGKSECLSPPVLSLHLVVLSAYGQLAA